MGFVILRIFIDRHLLSPSHIVYDISKKILGAMCD